MGNRRVILFLLMGIAVCALLLWAAQRRVRFFPSETKVRAALFEEPLDALDSIAVERGETRMELRRQNGRWSLYAPFPSRVDQGAVTRLLDAFENARVDDALSFQDLRRRELSPKEFGLSPASVRVVLRGPQRLDEIRFGALSPLGKEVYARVNQMDQILVLPVSLNAALPRTADDLRSRKLLHCDRSLLRTIEIRTPGRPFIKLSKETGTWRLVQPAAAPAADDKVESLLDRLYDARVSRFVWPTVSNVMDVAETDSALKTRMELYGLGADAPVQIHVQEASPAGSAKLVFGRPLDDADAFCYVLLQGGETIGAVSNDVPKAFGVMPSDLRDTRLFFEKPDSVRQMKIWFGDLLFVLSQTNTVWHMRAPISDVADQHAVKDAVEQLLRLKAERVVDTEGGGSLSGAEQSPPVSYVELVSDQTAQRFSVASDDYEGRYYRISFTNAPTVFLVANSNVPPAFVSMVGLLGLRDKTVLSLSAESVRRITVRRARGKDAVLQREADGSAWRLGEGVSGKVNAARLKVWLSRLVSLRADRIEKLGLALEDVETYGFASPWLEISVDVDAADAVRKTLLVGKEAGFGKRYAMVRGLDVLFVLDKETLRVLASALVDPL